MVFYTVSQAILNFLDLAGIAAIGILGALTVADLQFSKPDSSIVKAIRFFGLENNNAQSQMLIIGMVAIALLTAKSILSVFFTKKIIFFLSENNAEISTRLIAQLLSKSLLYINSKSTQSLLFATTRGIEVLLLQVLATFAILVSDVTLLMILLLGLVLIDITTAMATLVIFGLVLFMFYKIVHNKIERLGKVNSELNVQSNEKIIEALFSYREAFVRNRRDFYASQIGEIRDALSENFATLNFMPYISKYVIETTIILGAFIMCGVQLIINDASQAALTLSIFLAAGTRIAPSILRIQQGFIQIRSGAGQSFETLSLIDELSQIPVFTYKDIEFSPIYNDFRPYISLKDVSLIYPNKSVYALKNIDLEIKIGEVVAIVGSSGAGKTTLVDAILGVLPLKTGKIEISGLPPHEAIQTWPGAIAYVPQDILISAGTIRENVSMGYPLDLATDEMVFEALEIAQLAELVKDFPQSLDTLIGERGVNLSGGQRQRLGIARAMFTKPKLLILDEATSSLDGETEANISSSLQKLRGNTTILMIAHRLSTVRNADKVVYMEEGFVKAQGNFDLVRKLIPNFDTQAKLMGL